jgi:DnaJ-domain-containing protein 1
MARDWLLRRSMTPTSEDFRRLITRLAVAVMAADGRITQSELDALSSLDRLGLGRLSSLAREEIERAVEIPIDVRETCTHLASLSPEAGTVILVALASIASSDRVMAPEEGAMLRTIARLLGLDPTVARQILASATAVCSGAPGEVAVDDVPPARPAARAEAGAAAPERLAPSSAPPGTSEAVPPVGAARAWANEVLGIEDGATLAQVNAAYLRLVEHYNPAKITDLGPEFARLAVHRLADVTAAYEAVMEALGP